jgi:hypothetical protein
VARERKNEYRDTNGQFAYFGGFDRMCVCGHTLGIHCAGGFDCFAGQNGFKAEAESAGLKTPCDCQKFRPSRKKTA